MKIPLDANRVTVRIHPEYMTTKEEHPFSPMFQLTCGYVVADIDADMSNMTYGKVKYGGRMQNPKEIHVESLQDAIMKMMQIGAKAREDTLAPIKAAERVMHNGHDPIDQIIAHMSENNLAEIAGIMAKHEISHEELEQRVTLRMDEDSEESGIVI